MAEAKLLSERLKKFGTVGAGVVYDSTSTLELAGARAAEPAAEEPGSDGKSGVADVDGHLTRDQVLHILRETAKVQAVVQKDISALARKIAKERAEKKKKKNLSFLEAHKRIQELDLPTEPLEEHGLTDPAFQRILAGYEDDEEVMSAAREMLQPAGNGDPVRSRAITMAKIIEVHTFMVDQMQKVLAEFLGLPQEVRRTFRGKGCETTAELLVSIAVERQMAVRCEDVEQAVVEYEEELQSNQEFTRCTDQLAGMMQHLIGAAQPRVEKEEFLRILKGMAEAAKRAKAFAKRLFDDYRSRSCNIADAYRRFEAFASETTEMAGADEAMDLSAVELRLCFDEYRDDPEVQKIWTQPGVEGNIVMQAMTGPGSPLSMAQPTSAPVDGKGRKLKPSEIIEMQELMVDELKRLAEAAGEALKGGAAAAGPWKAELCIPMVQALASAAVERRYGVSAEEMTVAGFQHVSTLQQSERFVRATEKQQEIIFTLPQLCAMSDPDAPGVE